MHRKWWAKRVPIFVLALLLLETVSGCGPTPTVPEPKEWVVPTPRNPLLSRLEQQPFFVPDQVIVIGPEARIPGVLEAAQGQFAEITDNEVTLAFVPVLEEPLRLTYLSELARCPSLSPDYSGRDDIVMELYALTGSIEAPDELVDYLYPQDRPIVLPQDFPEQTDKIPIAVVAATLINQEGNGKLVFADLSYLTGHAWSYASPYEPAASPWEAHSPQLPGGTSPEALRAFETQWAFGQERGINLVQGAEDGTYTRSVESLGHGVRIGVFDTSPFPSEGMYPVDWLPSTLTPAPEQGTRWKVVHPPFYADWPGLPEQDQPDPILNEHGLAVAGLAYAVAPGSEIYLYRVLNRSLQGDLFTLNAALHTFIGETVAAGNRLNGAVINLSLGGHAIPGMLDSGLLNKGDLWIFGLTGDMFPPSVTSLGVLLSAAYCHDIVVVAAAGNHSKPEQRLDAQIPASFEEVLAVEANDIEGNPSCFSNRGTVSAPGGFGSDERPDGESCTPVLDSCQGNCWRYALIAPILNDNDPGYSYWSGTSFATPLVSGLAALLLEQNNGLSPQEVYDQILSIADQDGGIIDVQATMEGPE